MKKKTLSTVRILLLLLTALFLYSANSFAADSGAQTLTKTALTSVESKEAGRITVKWEKNTTGKGYEIQYSTDKSFKTATKSKIVKHSTTVAKVLKGLTKKRTYYVRIRTKKGDKHSGWSRKKKVKVKGDSSSGGGTNSTDYTVCVTDTGSKYHLKWCPTLKSQHEVTRSWAISHNYGACKVCKPG